jgi:RNA methyltransferase, TrmH family
MLTKAALQRLRSLREKKTREALGLFVVEGEKVIRELLAANYPFEEIFTTSRAGFSPPSFSSAPAAETSERAEARPTNTPNVTEISAEEMARISHFPTPSSVLALGRISHPTLAPGALDRGLTLALDGVQDAGNVGTLLRVADWFGFDRVLLSPDCADLFHQKVINASMGSFARVAAHTVDLAITFPTVSRSTPILACDLDGTDVHTLGPFRDAITVIGSEGRGLSAALRPLVTHYVTIPKYGAAESLNAAVAAAVVCDNLRRVLK